MQGVAKLARGDGNVGLLDVPEPEPIPGHVLIEVKAAGVCGTDLHIYHDEYPSSPPVIMGHELAGIVAEVGEGVTSCRPGDRVTSETYFYTCGQCAYCRGGAPNLCPSRKSIGSGVHGAFARYVLVPEHNVHLLPPQIDELAGALSEPLACCVHALEMTRVDPGDVALVSGPGAVGLLMAQVAKAAGARVVVVGTTADEARLAMARTLGADRTLNVQVDAVKRAIDDLTGGAGVDVAFECAGAGPSAQSCLALLGRRGRYAQVGLFGKPVQWDMDQLCFKEIRVSASFAHVPSAWPRAMKLLAAGQVQTRPLVSQTLPIAEWQAAFEAFERREGLKTVLIPS
jgi:L-iditol 2-dehydrogenase